MQTVEQIKTKFEEMLKANEEATRNKLETLLSSGAINFSEYEDNYLLPKILLHVIYDWLAWQTKPLSPGAKEEAANLKRF